MQKNHEMYQSVVSIDPVVFSLIDNKLHILLLKRGETKEPYAGTWMLVTRWSN